MGVLEKLTNMKFGWAFQPGSLTEYTGNLKNPGRGWYQIHTFLIENEPDLDELEWCIDKHDALAALVIDIGSCRNRNLENTELSRIRKILKFFQEYGFDVIVRVVYDHEGMAIEREPDFFSQIQQHIEQLWRVLSDFDDTIFIFQGMLIGNWGEMHTSKFLAPEKLDGLAGTLRENKSYPTFLAVRRPMFWRKLHAPGTDPAEKPKDLMGLFDDAILGSATDLGTYGDKDAHTAGWENAWRREDELEFENKLCIHVPNGGEVVYGEGYTDALGAEEILGILQKKHITYLNRLHDARVLEKWKQTKPIQQPLWKDKTFYEYVGAHLGYRFLVKKASVKPDKNNGRDFATVELAVENRGFANLYEEAALVLVSEEKDGKIQEIPLAYDMRKWDAGGLYTVIAHMKVFEGRLYLLARRKKDGTEVRFANTSDKEGKVFLGEIVRK